MWGWFSKPQKDLTALRVAYLHHECDLSEGMPSEDDFQVWLEQLDTEDHALYEDLGEIALARSNEGDGADVWDWLGGDDARHAWQHYQRANQSWGVVQWVARAYSWLHGLPWF